MKKKIAILAILLCVASTSTAFARGNHGYHGGGYHGRSYYNGHHHYSRHHNDGLGIAVGVVGGLILGSALAQSATPPQAVVYGSPYTTYQPEVVVQQPRVCVEDRRITGEWQISQFDGRQVWVSFPYPVIRRVQVPCY